MKKSDADREGRKPFSGNGCPGKWDFVAFYLTWLLWHAAQRWRELCEVFNPLCWLAQAAHCRIVPTARPNVLRMRGSHAGYFKGHDT